MTTPVKVMTAPAKVMTAAAKVMTAPSTCKSDDSICKSDDSTCKSDDSTCKSDDSTCNFPHHVYCNQVNHHKRGRTRKGGRLKMLHRHRFHFDNFIQSRSRSTTTLSVFRKMEENLDARGVSLAPLKSECKVVKYDLKGSIHWMRAFSSLH